MRPHGRRARVNAGNPEAFAQCDRCGFWLNRSGLQWQYQWSGTHIYSLGILVCDICYDTPFEQLRTIILPPDPPPVVNARPPNFNFEEAGPIQGILASTAPTGSNTLVLQPANGSVNGASSFTVGEVVWVQLVDAKYSANISFSQMQITGISGNSLTVKSLNSNVGLPATAPINGSVTLASTAVVPQQVPTLLIGANGELFVDINGNIVEIS